MFKRSTGRLEMKKIIISTAMIITTSLSLMRDTRAAPVETFGAVSQDLSIVVHALDDRSDIIHVPGDFQDLQDAINQVADGGIIELAAGVYPSPSGGLRINDVHKGFTIRAAPDATVILDGGGSRDLIRFQNSSISASGPIIFERLNFSNGSTNIEGLAAGVTIYKGRATFVDCIFQNNIARVSTTVGGAVYVADSSVVFFFNNTWINNSSYTGGGGLGIRSNAKVYIHQSQFINNSANPPNSNNGGTGGAINTADSMLRISNSRFVENQAGAHGGAIYSIGTWSEPLNVPRSDVLIANSTFLNNQAARKPSVPYTYPNEGGAINAEDQTLLTIYNSRFTKNRADIGGGVNSYRAKIEIYDSVFLGNQADGTVWNSSFGGSISISSNDSGPNNRPPGELVVEDTYIQGRYETVTTVAQSGGCIFAGGDGNRIDGNPEVPDMGTVEENRAKVNLRRVILNDCDTSAVPPYSSTGGALLVAVADLTMEDSFVINSDAFGDDASGGGIMVLFNSIANIEGVTIAQNTAGKYGGGLFVQGSTINMNNGLFLENEVSPGVSEPEHQSYGAAIFSTPDTERDMAVSGEISNSLLINNVGVAVFDDDRVLGPINDVIYNGNQFFSLTFGDKVYKDSLTPSQNVAGLNSLVVTRSGGLPSTDKSQIDNTSLSSEPILGRILDTPASILPSTANGDPPPPTSSYIAYVWNGQSANLNGSPLGNKIGVEPITSPGIFTLYVDSDQCSTEVFQGPIIPFFSLDIISGEPYATLIWDVSEGSFLDNAIDQGVTIDPQPSGSVEIPEGDKKYYFYTITEEGGDEQRFSTNAPILAAPDTISILAGLNLAVTRSSFTINNTGGQTMEWTAQSGTPDLIQLETPSGSTISTDVVEFIINVENLPPDTTRFGQILIDAGDAGSFEVDVEVFVVEHLYQHFLPFQIK